MKFYIGGGAIDLKFGRPLKLMDSDTKEGKLYLSAISEIQKKREQKKEEMKKLPFFKRLFHRIFKIECRRKT